MNYYNGNGRQPFDWLRIIRQDDFIFNLLADLLQEQFADDLTSINQITHNPVTYALANDDRFVENATARYGKAFNRTSVSKAATICQMILFDQQRGPEKDNKPKALRRHWYAWFKTRFAQPFALQLGDFTVSTSGVIVYNDLAWSQRLSQVYAWFVDNARYQQDPVCPKCQGERLYLRDWANDRDPDAYRCDSCGWTGERQEPVTRTCTYRDLWVEDASRMMAKTDRDLFKGINLIVAVEKDSLFDDFANAARALGATAVISGKGKSSKAAIEKLLRDHFGWTDERTYDYQTGTYRKRDIFTPDTPIHVIHVSDHDFDGQAVIGPTFGEQLRRYTPYVREARVGIKPEDLAAKGYDPADVMYSVKLSNAGYTNWATNQALFLAECAECGHQTVTKGSTDYSDERYAGDWPNACPECGGPFLTLYVDKKGLPADRDVDIAYGLEVEAMTSADYRDLLVKALLTIIDFDYIVERLRAETLAYDQFAAERIRDYALENNADYQQLLADYQDLERRKQRFENAVLASIWAITAKQADAYPHQGDDPISTDYSDHVVRGEFYAWSPFSRDERTNMLVQDFQNHQTDLLVAWQQEDPEDYDTDNWDYIDTSQLN